MNWVRITEKQPEYKQWIITFDSENDEIGKTRYRPNEVDYDLWMLLPEPPTASNNEFKATKAP